MVGRDWGQLPLPVGWYLSFAYDVRYEKVTMSTRTNSVSYVFGPTLDAQRQRDPESQICTLETSRENQQKSHESHSTKAIPANCTTTLVLSTIPNNLSNLQSQTLPVSKHSQQSHLNAPVGRENQQIPQIRPPAPRLWV